MTTRSRRPELRVAGLHLLVLSSFAIAQPLFDLLGSNAEFFGARDSTRWDVVLFALVLVLVPPALLLAVEAVVPRIHLFFVAGLVGLFVLQAIRGTSASGWLLVVLAAAAGVAGAAVYAAVPAARLVVTALAPAPLLFLAVFLFASEASELTLSGTPSAYAATAQPRLPAILVVFDELPTNSLLDRHGVVDPVRFPHFAALQRSSTWFANESVVSEGTLHSVPSILTGRFARPDELPVYHDHPRNLFTLLGGDELHVVETETHLCPPKLCPEAGDSFVTRFGSLYADTSIVYLHELLPDDLARGVPSVSNGWQDFWHNGLGGSDPERRFNRFVKTIKPTRTPALWYLHLLLPHSPWRFLPSGRRYEIRQPPGWSSAEVWTDNQAAVDQYWQRHLLQLGYADRLLGKLVARLRAAGLYDRSLLVVTADHGVSFRAGEKRRPASSANLRDIAFAPLFVKLPHQHRGRIVRRPTRSVDVLPTIAAVLGVRIPWHVDGQNVLSHRRPEPDITITKDHGKRFVVPAKALDAKRQAALRRQLALFGSDEPPSRLYAVGPYRSLFGKRLADLHVRPGGRVDLDGLDLSSALIQVSGKVGRSVHNVAVAARGRIVAVVPAQQGRFWAIVPRAELAGTPHVFAVEGPSFLRVLGAGLPSSE